MIAFIIISSFTTLVSYLHSMIICLCLFFYQDCSGRMLYFQKYQDLPTKSAYAVEQFSIDGSLFLGFANFKDDINGFNTDSYIYKLDDSTGRFYLYQTIDIKGGRDMEYFMIADKHYLAVANRMISSTSRLNSAIYQWNGHQFIVVQNIPTLGATSFNFFKILSDLFLVVTNCYDDITRSLNSVIYKWGGNQFSRFQEIRTEDATACTTFAIRTETFLVFVNFRSDQQGYYAQSPVYKWSGNSFVKLQSVQTYGAYDVKSFSNNGETFLAFANWKNGNSYNIDSFIYKWNGSRFVLFQSIPTNGARAWEPFAICGETFLAVANHEAKSVSVYRLSGSQFIKYQEISTQHAADLKAYEYKGHTYLAIANYRDTGWHRNINSALYKLVYK